MATCMAGGLLYQYIKNKKERLRLKLRTTKKIVSCILSVLLLAFALVLPVSANEISDSVTDENTKSYLVNEEKTFDGTTSSKLDISEDIDFFKDNTSATWTVTFKTTANSFQSLVGLFSESNENGYVNIYLNSGNTIGIEIRGTENTSFSFSKTYNDGEFHTLSFTVKENEYYKFYFDGECVVNKSATSTKFTNNFGVSDLVAATIGGSKRSNASKDWSFNGTIKDVYMSNFALDETELLKFHGIFPAEVISETNVKDTTGTEPLVVTDDFDLDAIKAMDQGSINITYKRDSSVAGASLQSYLAFSNGDAQDEYATFYLNSAGTRVGFEFKTAAQNPHTFWDGVNLNDGNWHNLGFVFDGTNVTLYVDGVSKGAKAFTGMFSALTWINNLNTVSLGGMVRTGKTGASNQWFGDFNVNNVKVYSNVLSASQMASIQNGTGSVGVSEEDVSDRTALFYSGYGNSANYRIPAMVTAADGTLVASIDQRKTTAADYGDIDLMVRRSEDKGETWSEPIMLTDLPSGGSNHSFIIDSELLVAGDGTIYCLVDMFPESLALMGALDAGSGYTDVDGTKYLTLYDAEKNIYTMREDNIVYDAEGNVTNYKVTDFSTGKLVKTVEGEEVDAGSIFLYTGANAGELSVLKTSYLWLFKSTDNGLTWSEPKDVTGMVKEDWMVFCGTGPGRGTTTIMPDGTERLIFSIYHTNKTGGLSTQASATIYSDDGGETWTRGAAAVEALGEDPSSASRLTQLTENQVIDLGGGKIVMFSRNYSGAAYMSISTNGGETWDSCERNPAVYDTYCQMSAFKHEYNGKTYLIISNPNASGRNNMTIRVTDITDGTISKDSADWKYTTINVGHDQYSCLTSIDENTIGILYETDTTWHALDMLFQKFSIDYLLEGNGGNVNNVPEYPEITDISAEVINGANGSEGVTEVGDTIKVKVTLGVPVFVTGNAQVKLQYNVGDETKTVYADYAGGSGTNEIYFNYTIEEKFNGDISAVIEPIANLESSTLRGVSSLRNGETIAVASYGISADDGSFDLAVTGAEAGSFHAGEGADKAIDKNTSTMWHSEWAAGNNRDDLWITLDLGAVKDVTGLRYMPRQTQTNGIITEYDILVSTDGSEFTSVATGTWAGDNSWKKAEFESVKARYVKLVAVNSLSTEAGNTYASATEIALYYVPGDETEPDYREELETAILMGENKLGFIAENPETFWYVPDVTALEEKVAEAYTLLENTEATNEQLMNMIDELDKATDVRYMSGDIDMNGKITIIDATVLQLYLNEENLGETDIAVIASDTDGSGEIDINDITEIQKYIVDIVEYLAPYEMIIS